MTEFSDLDPDHLFSAVGAEKRVVVAVSGGSDSMALLYLLHQWQGVELVVATIDHQLRKASSDEAIEVGKICQGLGIRHIARCWEGEKPRTGLSSLAREARYRLLSEIAIDVGATAIVLGHTLDDQRETVLMRAERLDFDRFSAGVDENSNRGLAGIRPEGIYCGPPDFLPVKLIRPLLGVGRAVLRRFLESQGRSWIDDPSNVDARYERVRLRTMLDNPANKMPSRRLVSSFAEQAATKREDNAGRCGDFIHKHVTCDNYRVFCIEGEAYDAGDEALMILVLRILLAEVGGRNYLVSPDAARHLATMLREGDDCRHTLGAVVLERHNKRIRLWRENRNLPVVLPDEHLGHTIVWDGRIVFDFRKDAFNQQLVIGALSTRGLAFVEELAGQRFQCSPRAALYSQPALFIDEKPVFVPWLGWQGSGFAPPATRIWTPALELFQLDCDRKLLKAIHKLRAVATLGKPNL